MTDIMSPATRSRVMSKIRGKNTTPERYMGVLLRAAGLHFRQHDNSLPGRPDLVFPEAKVAVFVDGDFWHGWRFPLWKHKLAPFWSSKIAKNRSRDTRNYRKLSRIGWNVVRIWEHEVETDPVRAARRIVQAVGAQHVSWSRVEAQLRSLPPLKRRPRLPKP